MKRKLIVAKILILVFGVLVIVNIFQIDFDNIKATNFFNIIENILGIILMVVNIKDMKNAEK